MKSRPGKPGGSARTTGRNRVVLLASALLLVVAACSGGGGEESEAAGQAQDASPGQTEAEGEQVTLTYMTQPAESAEQDQMVETILEECEAQQPNVELQREIIPLEEQRQVLQTQLSAGAGPDVFAYDTGPGFSGVLAAGGLLYDLGPAYEEHGWEIYDWAQQRVTYDGQLSGVPTQIEEVGIYYNVDMFEDLGLEPPETLEELTAVADALQQEDLIPFAFGNAEQWPATHQFSMTASNLLGREGLDEVLYGDVPWDSPEVVRAIEIPFRDFVDRGYYPPSPNAITYEDANSLFYSGRAGMLPTGTWLVSELDSTVEDFEVGFFPFPSIDGSGVFPPSGLGSGYFVSANTPHPEEAIAFLDCLQQPDIAQTFVEDLGIIPAHPVDVEGLEISPLFEEILADLQQLSEGEAADFGYNIDVLTPAVFNDVMFTGFQQVMSGSRTPEEQAQALQAAWEEAKAAGETLEVP